ncbi:hypothetical protein HGRIS_008119 [Hohenbuehelia grisea]|uniref:Exocyst complex component Sec3 PIP2-binding N-terminal domain-containing protein n=1 Tax=Hohenbuehelia grisea TaxID=104357 RepID=A0ABR3J763_9AGAR
MDVRRRIISSVFERSDGSGLLEESYVAHLRIWEDAGPEGGESKSRYILLSRSNNGGYIHKSKANSNGSFSVGKTWRLLDLRAIQVINPLVFNITLARTYRWHTENADDQLHFLNELIRLFQSIAPNSSLRLEGIGEADTVLYSQSSPRPPPAYTQSGPNLPSSPSRRPGTGNRTPAFDSPGRARVPDHESPDRGQLSEYGSPGRGKTLGYESPRRGPSPQPVSQMRAETPTRMGSPSRLNPNPATTARPRLPSVSRQQPSQPKQPETSSSTIRPGPARPSSNDTSSSNQIPSINLSPYPNGPPESTSHSRPHTNGSLSARTAHENPLTPTSAYPTSPARSRTPSPPPPSVRSRKTAPKESRPTVVAEPQPIRQINPRVSFFDPANQATLDRLVTGDAGEQTDIEGEDESVQATLANIEEMLEGYEWASDDVIGRKTARGTADLIEARLLDELTALDKANIHSFLESDDRIGLVLQYMDAALTELDNMDSLISSYKIHLNAVSDDISYIQSQGRGLQVQTQNQRALLGELENLLQTVHVDRSALAALSQESLEKPSSIQRLEEAAAELYKALLAGRDTDMTATNERIEDYTTHNAQFCKRLFDFISLMFVAQSKMVLGDHSGVTRSEKRGRSTLDSHKGMEDYLGRYAGLLLYLKEMNEATYGRLCAAYFSAVSELHSTQMKALLSSYLSKVKKASDEDLEIHLGSPAGGSGAKGTTGMRRAGTLIRSPLETKNKDRDKVFDGDLRAADALGFALEQITVQVYHEDEFLADFLQINDAQLTFADYMSLDNYFRRQAGRAAGLSSATVKLIRNAMDLIFGFLPAELKSWADQALTKDSMEVVGLLSCIERARVDANERGHAFMLSVLDKQHMRLKGQFDRHINDQVKSIEQTKLTSKKRRGVAPFVKQFPMYIRRVELQLVGSDDLEIRSSVDEAYDRIVQRMFESLKHMAKMDGEGEDKGQLNYHVIMIENMHHFVSETSQLEIGSVASFSRKAEAIYDENVSAYVKIVLRRPFAKLIDYFEGVEQQLKSVAPTEIIKTSTYSKSALKKVVKEFNSKDVRKHVDVLFKRVEKHFTDAEKAGPEEGGGIAQGTVMVGVWKACEEEMLRITELFAKRIGQCYAESGVSLEYSSADVEGAFRRHRVE